MSGLRWHELVEWAEAEPVGSPKPRRDRKVRICTDSRRLEKGDARISIGVIAQAFLVLGELNKITGLLDTASDEIGLSLMNEQLPQRVRNKKRTVSSGAL